MCLCELPSMKCEMRVRAISDGESCFGEVTQAREGYNPCVLRLCGTIRGKDSAYILLYNPLHLHVQFISALHERLPFTAEAE